ncbi:MAG: FlgD immunoglobulin-like domain containing protein [Calditrichia bacterium]
MTALPGQITRIKATFDKPGRYVWHCHILSHEDQEMMRVLHVGGGVKADRDIAENNASLQTNGYALEQNYPNPFNPTTEIGFQLPAEERVELSIFNGLGQKVRTLVNEVMPAGTHKVTWDARDGRGNRLASGMYIYRIKAGNFSEVKRMTLLR